MLKFRQYLTEEKKPKAKKKPKKPEKKPLKVDSSGTYLFLKANPPSDSHFRAIQAAQKTAEKNGTKLKVIVSHSDVNERNPIDPKRKLDHIKAMVKGIPGVDVEMADPSQPTIIHHVRKANQNGIRNIMVLGGGAKAKHYEKVLKGYNGREYNFETITVKDIGKLGTGHISSEELRNHAHDNNFENFRKGLPEPIRKSLFHSRKIFQDTCRGLKQCKKKEKK